MAQVIDLSRGGIGVFAGPGRATNILALLGLLLLTACSSKPYEPAPVDEIRPGILRGYLPVADLPDSLGLLPAPPALGSAAEAQDVWLSGMALRLKGSPRWTWRLRMRCMPFRKSRVPSAALSMRRSMRSTRPILIDYCAVVW